MWTNTCFYLAEGKERRKVNSPRTVSRCTYKCDFRGLGQVCLNYGITFHAPSSFTLFSTAELSAAGGSSSPTEQRESRVDGWTKRDSHSGAGIDKDRSIVRWFDIWPSQF